MAIPQSQTRNPQWWHPQIWRFLTAFMLAAWLLTPFTKAAIANPNEDYYFYTLAGLPGGYGNVDGAGSAARFYNPTSVAVDSAGNVYVADTLNHTIRKVTAGGVVTTLAGLSGNYGSADGTGSAARFYFPEGVAVDSAGNVYVADLHHTIRKVTAGGVVTTLAGLAGTSGSANGTGSAARFNDPMGVAVDSAGNVYVADQSNYTIRKVTASGVVTTLAGLAGSSGSANGTGSAARFYYPSGVAVDSARNVYVSDSNNHTLRKVTPAGVVTTLVGLAGSSGTNDGIGNAARFNQPSGVAVDNAGNVYVADTYNYTIRKVTAGEVVTTLAGLAGSSGSANGTGSAARFYYPRSVAVDSAGNVYVADTGSHTIRKVTAGGVVTTLAGWADYGSSGSADGMGNAARFKSPNGVAADSAGNVYVADRQNYTIRKVMAGGVVTTLAGSARSSGTADGTGSAARFYFPRGVAVDSAGNVYVADEMNHTIRKVTASGVVTTMAGLAGSSGTSNGTGSAARFNEPEGVAVDNAGNVYVADAMNSTIRKVTPGGVVTTLAGLAGSPDSVDGTGSAARFYLPSGVAVDSAGNVYVASFGSEGNTIRKVTPGGVVTTLAGLAGTSGSANGTGSAARFNDPMGVAVDSAGNVYVTDTYNHTIRKVTASGVVTTIGGRAGQVAHVDGLGNTARFNQPQGIACDAAGRLYISDDANVISVGLPSGEWVPPTLSAQPTNQAVTAGGVVGFNVTASSILPLYYSWLRDGTLLSSATNSQFTITNVQWSDAGIYCAVVSNAFGSVTSQLSVLTVLSPPVITAQLPNQVGILGSTVNIDIGVSGTAPLSFQWYKDGRLILGVTSNPLVLTDVQRLDQGDYYVVISNYLGSVASAITTLTIVDPASVKQDPQGLTALFGSATSLTVRASGTLPLYYQWYRDGTALLGANSSILPLADLQTSQTGEYHVVVTNSYGAATSAVAVITVLGPPYINIQPQSRSALLYGDASFAVNMGGTAPLSYQWLKNGTNLPNALNNPLFLFNIQWSDIGTYSVIITNQYGSITSSVATLTVLQGPSIVQSPLSLTGLVGAIGSLTVSAKGAPPLYYQWFKTVNSNQSSVISGATNSSLILNPLSLSDAGNYWVVVSNAYAKATSAVATVTVLSPPYVINQPQNVTAPVGGSANFSVTAGGTTPVTYQWYKSVISGQWSVISGATNLGLQIVNCGLSDMGSYQCVVANAYGSATSAVATLYINPGLANGRFTNSAQIAINDNTTATPYPSTIAVNSLASSIQRVKVTLRKFTHTYMSDVRVLLVSPSGQKVLLLSGAGNSGVSQVNLTFDDFAAGPVPDVPTSGIYKPTATTTGSLTTPAPAAPYATTLAALKGQDPNGTWSLYVLDSSAGDGGYITEGWSLDIETATPPFITSHPPSQTVNTGGSTAFTVGVAGAQPLFYQWRFNGSTLSGATNATLTLANVQGAQAGNYTVVVTNASGSTTSLVATLTVLTTDPPYITSQPQDLTMMAGDTATLTVQAGGTAPLAYQWFKGGAAILAATNSSLILNPLKKLRMKPLVLERVRTP
ncbi:MAG: immunoglobulin domain-containing protein, partial [Verrucomicrobiota bacterium]